MGQSICAYYQVMARTFLNAPNEKKKKYIYIYIYLITALQPCRDHVPVLALFSLYIIIYQYFEIVFIFIFLFELFILVLVILSALPMYLALR